MAGAPVGAYCPWHDERMCSPTVVGRLTAAAPIHMRNHGRRSGGRSRFSLPRIPADRVGGPDTAGDAER